MWKKNINQTHHFNNQAQDYANQPPPHTTATRKKQTTPQKDEHPNPQPPRNQAMTIIN
ncbi:hypothetical protein [Breznakibacter xylanolyticus]|uniref:hypothetical protein n=1 Tax=Breznakibacter xylanolyticus TaxID=990 RepID=UPI0014740041|nr:hypothetical protein [Breznakibacter xylanolyticus]